MMLEGTEKMVDSTEYSMQDLKLKELKEEKTTNQHVAGRGSSSMEIQLVVVFVLQEEVAGTEAGIHLLTMMMKELHRGPFAGKLVAWVLLEPTG